MTSHRSRFLASLNERLQSDLAARELDQDDPTALPWPEHPGHSGEHDRSWSGEMAGDEIAGHPKGGAAQIELAQDPEPVAVAPPGAVVQIEAFAVGDGELPPHPSVPWSEAGMPLRLREAIASVRRVSHEMHEPTDDDHAMGAPVPPTAHEGSRDCPFDEDAAYEEPPSDHRPAWLESDAGPADEPARSGDHTAYQQRPPDDELALLDEGTGFQDAPTPVDDDAGFEEPQTEDELVPLGHDALDGQRRFAGHTGYDDQPADDAPIPLGDPVYQDARIRLDPGAAYRERPPVDEAAHVPMWLADDWAGQESEPGRPDAVQDRQRHWRGRRARYAPLAAAFSVAIAFVALAGFGLGVLSDGGPLTRDSVGAGSTEPAPSANEQQALRTESEEQGELSELVTVRVAPAPVTVVPGEGSAARVSTSPPPLPPPPKPALPQTDTGAPASANREVASAVDDAFAALLEAEGAGGPFEPLFAKLPASPPTQTRVFVHYTASAVGAPATAMHLVRHLRAEGFAVEARPVEVPIPTNSIRYFFEADRAQAEVLRSSLEGQIRDGAALSIMDFTSFEPRPRPGLIEIWLRA